MHCCSIFFAEQRWSDSDSVDCDLGQRSQNPVTDVSMDETEGIKSAIFVSVVQRG